jgi:transposase-like protein
MGGLPRLSKGPSGKTSRAVHCRPAPNADGGEYGKDHATRQPAKRALAALDNPAPAEPLPTRRISKKVRAAIDAMVSGDCKTIKEAAEKVGLARESLSRALSKPHVAEHLRQKVLRHLAIAAARAGATKVELLDSANEMVRDRASTFVLGLADIAPATAPSLNVNLEMRAGFVIDIAERPAPSPPTLRVIPHE